MVVIHTGHVRTSRYIPSIIKEILQPEISNLNVFQHITLCNSVVLGSIQKLRRQEGVGGWSVKCLHLPLWKLPFFIYFISLRGVGECSKKSKNLFMYLVCERPKNNFHEALQTLSCTLKGYTANITFNKKCIFGNRISKLHHYTTPFHRSQN